MYQSNALKIRHCGIILYFCYLSLMMNGSMSSELDSEVYVDIDNCTLTPEKPAMEFRLNKLIEGDNRLINLDITVIWNSQPPAGLYPEQMTWTFTIDDSGRHLLLLDDHFVAMSLRTLSYGIVKMPLRLTQEPLDCLANMTATSAEKYLAFALLNLPSQLKDEENVVSPFYICTGSVNSNGKCCNITYSGDNVQCYNLESDSLITIFSWIMASLTCIAWAHGIYLIPKFVYEEDESTYKVHDTVVRMKLKIVMGQSCSGEKLSKVIKKDYDSLLRDITEKIETILTSAKEANGSKDTETQETCNLDVKLESINLKNSKLVSELNAADDSLKYLMKNMYINAIFKFCIIVLCLLLFVLRICAAVIFLDRTVSGITFYISSLATLLFGVISILISCFCCPKVLHTDSRKNVFIESLQIVEKTYSWERAKSLGSPSPNPPYKGLLCIHRAFYFGFTLLPLLPYTAVLYKLANCIVLVVFFVLFIASGMVVIVSGAVFFMKCFAYVVLGLILNYDQVTDILLLILMISVYSYNCIQNVFQHSITFNKQVFKIIRDTENSMYASSLKENKNVAIRLDCRDDGLENEVSRSDGLDNLVSSDDEQDNVVNGVGLEIRKDLKEIICTSGLFIFYQYQEPERLSYMHIPKLFLDQVASLPGHLTPGSKCFLLIRAGIEIVAMLVAAVTIFIAVHSYGRVHDISATAHTIATVVTSAAFMMFNSLFFEANEYTINDHHTHLKTLIRRHIYQFKDTFKVKKINILGCEFLDTLNHDHDMVVEVCTDTSGKVKATSCFLKKLHQTEPDNIMQGVFGFPGNVSRCTCCTCCTCDNRANRYETCDT